VDLGLLRELDALALRAWPALEVRELDGWRLRWSGGVTRRANSVWAGEAGALPLQSRLAPVHDFYASRGHPAQFQLTTPSVPAGLDAELDALGWRRDTPTDVQVAAIDVVASGGATGPVALSQDATGGWFAAWRDLAGLDAGSAVTLSAILSAVTVPTVHALVRDGGRPVAAGRAVLDGEWLGVFNIVTAADARRRGHATAVLRALARWGADGGASRAYLQVDSLNAPARTLYARAGFRTAYGYWYRIASS
jgi:GNAT superfamily N-acetyltransferase